IREALPAADSKRPPSIVEIVDAHKSAAATETAVPRVIPVARSTGQPANMAEAKSKSEADSDAETASAESEERNVSWRPHRIVRGIRYDRSRPPRPSAAIGHPAAVVIRCPTPGLIGNPGPTEVWLPHPAA